MASVEALCRLKGGCSQDWLPHGLESSVRQLWQPLRDLLARRIRYKITRGGLLFTFAIAMVAFGAMVSANNLLFLIVATMMATLLISGLVSRLCLAELNLDFFVPDHVPAGRTVPGRLYVRNDKWFIPSFSIRGSRFTVSQ